MTGFDKLTRKRDRKLSFTFPRETSEYNQISLSNFAEIEVQSSESGTESFLLGNPAEFGSKLMACDYPVLFGLFYLLGTIGHAPNIAHPLGLCKPLFGDK